MFFQKKFRICLSLMLFSVTLLAQEKENEVSVNQCAVIREVIYSAHEKQFDNLIQKEMKGSHGYQVRGSCRFETTQYMSLIDWPQATKTYIDHSEEKTDSSLKLIRQFVAEFTGLTSLEDARKKFDILNRQITDCRLPLNDSNITVLKPIPLDKIKDDLPVAALDARLYPITVKEAEEASPGQEVVIMTAYEKIGRYYSAYMIVEYRLRQGEWN
ncbi:MAG: hypothetical protein MUE99_03085 [Chitinophagaceae bacterium]|nr:hypothetical protein [Chitinophagaceae bacterium]